MMRPKNRYKNECPTLSLKEKIDLYKFIKEDNERKAEYERTLPDIHPTDYNAPTKYWWLNTRELYHGNVDQDQHTQTYIETLFTNKIQYFESEIRERIKKMEQLQAEITELQNNQTNIIQTKPTTLIMEFSTILHTIKDKVTLPIYLALEDHPPFTGDQCHVDIRFADGGYYMTVRVARFEIFYTIEQICGKLESFRVFEEKYTDVKDFWTDLPIFHDFINKNWTPKVKSSLIKWMAYYTINLLECPAQYQQCIDMYGEMDYEMYRDVVIQQQIKKDNPMTPIVEKQIQESWQKVATLKKKE